MDVVARIRDRTRAALVEMATSGALPAGADPSRFSVVPGDGPGRGDLTINAGLIHGGARPGSGRVIAARLADALASGPEVAAAEIAGPGYVNVTLSGGALTAALAACLAGGADYGRGAASSPIAVGLGPARDAAVVGLGRARAAVVADAVARILGFAGHPVLLPPDRGLPPALADLGRIGVAPGLCAAPAGDWPGGGPAILVHEAERGPPRLPWPSAPVETVAVGPCRLCGTGASAGRHAARLGDALDLADGAALRFAMLGRAPGQALALDPRAAADASHAGPVFDVRYAHARARRVVRHGAAAMPDLDLAPAALAQAPAWDLCHPGERAILRAVALYPDRIAVAATLRDPSRLAVFLVELARAVHGQWKSSKDQPQLRFVNEEQRDLTKARLGLVTAAALVLQSGLGVLGVSAPDEMR